MTADDERHGTYAGYQRHIKTTHTTPCAACREASAEYHRAHRAASEERRINESRYSGARSRAMTRLAALHPGQYQVLIEQELAR